MNGHLPKQSGTLKGIYTKLKNQIKLFSSEIFERMKMSHMCRFCCVYACLCVCFICFC